MISEKNYLKLFQKLPCNEAPKVLVADIIEKCGIADKKKQNRSGPLIEATYGLACLIIIGLIFTVGLTDKNASPINNSRLASNTVAFADQLSHGILVVFTGQN